MTTDVETIIIGAGQAGLSISYWLGRVGLEHLVLEKAKRPAHVWSDERWDSFTLVTPNWSFQLPGVIYHSPHREGYMNKAEIVQTFENFTIDSHLPIRYGELVTSVAANDGGYKVMSNGKTFTARNVVMATGMFQNPRIPDYAKDLDPGILQLHSSQYRDSWSLPPGGVLVVGSGQSGCQIADELLRNGRKVTLSTSAGWRVPRRYRGKDMFEWMLLMGFMDRTPAQLQSPKEKFAGGPQVTGQNGGKSLNLHQFAREGMQLVGHISGEQEGRLFLKNDLSENLRRADRAEADILQKVDLTIERRGYKVAREELPVLTDGYNLPEITSLDMKKAGISTIIWAQGFSFDYSLVKLPVLDSDGYPETRDCETRYPGLFFVGLPWLVKFKSGILIGTSEDAALIALRIAKRHRVS